MFHLKCNKTQEISLVEQKYLPLPTSKNYQFMIYSSKEDKTLLMGNKYIYINKITIYSKRKQSETKKSTLLNLEI